MKRFIPMVAVACQLWLLASEAVCQENSSLPERLHFSFSFPQGRKVLFELSATSANHVVSSPVLQLSGDVQVRMTTCSPQGHECVASPMVLYADAVDYNEATGQINAHGNVHTIFVDLSSKRSRAHAYEPEPLQRPVVARAGSAAAR